MAEEFEVIWSTQAELDLQEILLFWIENNKSKNILFKIKSRNFKCN